MIKVTVRPLDYSRCEIVVQGHADMQERGKDILCASVSALYTTLKSSICWLSESCIMSEAEADGYRRLMVGNIDGEANTLIKAFEIGCRNFQETYPAYIKVVA